MTSDVAGGGAAPPAAHEAPVGDAELLAALPDGVLVLDAGRRICAANEAAARLLGRSREQLAGATLDDLGVRDDAGRGVWADSWGAPERLGSVRGAPEQLLRLRAPDGRPLTLLASASYRRDGAGRVSGAIVALRESRRRQRRGAAGAIEIISTVSHELRSPLTSVKGYTSLLLNRWDRLDDEQKRTMLGQVNHDADRVTRLITELLDISRLESGHLTLRRRLLDLPELVSSVLERVRLEYPPLAASTEWPDALPRVWADPDKVEQVLTNLVENACKYASPVGLAVSAGASARHVWVSVADRGPGIPAEDLPRVFTKFFRRREGRPTGSGLGLWISRGLVEAHGGRLWAESILGAGSTFRFTLPVADTEDRSQA